MIPFLTLMIVMASMADPDHHLLLPVCPSSPNCVSSQSADNHFIAPFSITGDAKAAFDRLKKILALRNDSTIVAADDRVMRVEFKTTLGFVDDGLFILDVQNAVIHIRSASRIGYWDFGKNRGRIEEIRQKFR